MPYSLTAEWAAVIVAALIGAATVWVAISTTGKQVKHARSLALIDAKRTAYSEFMTALNAAFKGVTAMSDLDEFNAASTAAAVRISLSGAPNAIQRIAGLAHIATNEMMHMMLENENRIPEEIGSIASNVNQVLNVLMIADLNETLDKKMLEQAGASAASYANLLTSRYPRAASLLETFVDPRA